MTSEGRPFSEVNQVVASKLAIAFEWDQQMVDAVTDAVCFAIAAEYGGRPHYIPKRNGALRERIRREFNGRNIQSLSRKYSVSCSTVRRIVSKKPSKS